MGTGVLGSSTCNSSSPVALSCACVRRRRRRGRSLRNLTSSDEFLEKRFPESRRKAYYLMAIHQYLSKIQGGGKELRLCGLVAQGLGTGEGGVQAGALAAPDGKRDRVLGATLIQGVQEP